MNYFDLHCDTPYECYKQREKFYVNQLAISGEKGAAFENWTQCFSFWISDDTKNPWQLYRNIYDDFKAKINAKPTNLTPIFTLEGGAAIENDIERLHTLKQDGIKFITLTWNGENLLAGGAYSDKGLTDFGKETIKLMNDLKIGCDLSHLNEKSFYEAIAVSEYPLASHSNCRTLCEHPRNLNDFQLKLIAKSGGVIGLCFYPDFLDGDVFEGIYRNIFHLCDIGLEDNIAIGSDFDGGKMSQRLDNLEKIPQLYSYLEQKGLRKAVLDKIFYTNAQNYIAKLR